MLIPRVMEVRASPKSSDGLQDALKFARKLATHPEKIATVNLGSRSEIVVIERGAPSREGELMAVRLMPERRVALGRFIREHSQARWQLVGPGGTTRNVNSGTVQVLGRVLSVIHPSR